LGEHTFLSGDATWWRQAVIYQIYPRSFSDANGDGIGDLRGIINKLDYLKGLHIDGVWLSPFYPSELADGGYDVADYRNVDPRIGTLEEFDELVEKFHAAGIRIFIDIVPNHSSDQHVWFQEALKSPKGSAARARYLFFDGKGENGELPPSELNSHFGPTGWTRITEPDGTPGQWYLHLFAKEQPDFNWDNQEVRDDFLHTLRFWSDRGVDGFRIDVAHALAKDLSGKLPGRRGFGPDEIALDGSDPLFDRNEVHEIYKTWRKVFNEYDPPRVAVAESGAPAARRPLYASADELGQAFNFDLMSANWDRKDFKRIITSNLKASKLDGSSSTWVLSNHDQIRHTARYGLPNNTNWDAWYVGGFKPPVDYHTGFARARGAIMLMLALPGSTYLYQGEELGLPEVLDIPGDQMQDPQWFRNPGKARSRDGCRVPLPWNLEGSSFGFGSGGSHLPQPADWGTYSVEAQDHTTWSTLNVYREALWRRRQLQTSEDLIWVRSKRSVLHFARPNGWHSVTNFGKKPVKLPAGELLQTSAPLVNGKLPVAATAWLFVHPKL
jgi:alpha-glucosidase